MEIGGGGSDGVVGGVMMSTAPAKRRVSRVAIAIAVVSLVVGAVCLVRIIVTGASATTGLLSQPSFSIPGSTTVQIDEPGMYAIFEETGTQSQNGPITYSQTSFTVLRPKDVDVAGPDGRPVNTMPIGGNETLTRGSTIYTASVEFRAPTTGAYVVDVNGGRPGSSAVVGRELADQFSVLIPWLLVMVTSGFVFFFSIIAVIISAVRASKANRAMAQPAYPNPHQPAYPYGSPHAAPYPSAYPSPGPPQPYSAWPPAPTPPGPGGAPGEPAAPPGPSGPPGPS